MTSSTNSARRVLVTGASKGIGRGIAERLAKRGFDITVHYGRDEAGAEETLKQVIENGGTGRIVGFDVCELSPGDGPPACSYTAAKLVYKLAAYSTAFRG